jgi:rhodanese-related sulfurtransferase
MSSVDAAHAAVPDISREDLIRAMRDGRVTLVDVLSPESFASMHIPRAISLPVADLARRAKALLPDPRAAIVAYCGGPT